LALGPVGSWTLGRGGFSFWKGDSLLWGDVDLTLIEVGGFRSLRGGMGRCIGSGRTFSIVESVNREKSV
jgi:hypothetical protein